MQVKDLINSYPYSIGLSTIFFVTTIIFLIFYLFFNDGNFNKVFYLFLLASIAIISLQNGMILVSKNTNLSILKVDPSNIFFIFFIIFVLLSFTPFIYSDFSFQIPNPNYSGEELGLSFIRTYIFSSDSGILFPFTIGIILSFFFKNVKSGLTSNQYRKSIKNGLIFIELIIIFALILLLIKNLNNLSSHGFFVGSDSVVSKYQRPGNILFILSIIYSFMHIHKVAYSLMTFKEIAISTVFFSLSMINAILFGSNLGTLSIFVVALIHYSIVLQKTSRLNIKYPSCLVYKSTKKYIFGSIKIGLALMLAALILGLISYETLAETRLMRTWDHSLLSRLEILRETFFLQIGHSPFLGNLFVHQIFEMKYPHSLLSLLSHLGMVGFFFFVILVSLIYRKISLPRVNGFSPFLKYEIISSYSILLLTAVLMLCLISSFFTWPPMIITLTLLMFSSAR